MSISKEKIEKATIEAQKKNKNKKDPLYPYIVIKKITQKWLKHLMGLIVLYWTQIMKLFLKISMKL